MAMHNKKALCGLVLFKTTQHREAQKDRKCLEEGELDQECLVWISYQTRHQEPRALVRTAERTFTSPERGKGLRKSLWTPHTLPTLSLNCCLLVSDARHKNSFLTQAILSPSYCKTFITIHCPS